ncbi:antibiotic biosynthesis monooxygenase [Streptomyces cinnamoneus]|uniref:antibiotic biosynthesis monooxygenase family protein n=1 Tax=Streptomyces cinnamoneus TaxID=53446 RepID=UPI0034250B42
MEHSVQPATFRAVVSLRLRPGTAPEFEQTWSRIAADVRAQPANRGQWLVADSGDPERYEIVSDWQDEESFRAFERSEAHQGHRSLLAPFRKEVSMRTYAVRRTVAPRERPADAEVYVLVPASAERAEDVLGTYRGISAELAGTPGLAFNALLRDVADPRRYAVLSRWNGLEALRAFETDGRHDATAPLRRHRDEAAPARTFEVVDSHE